MNTPHPFDLVIGLDRSDKKADLCLIDTHSGQRRSLVIDTAPEALWEWLMQLRRQHPDARVGTCLEQPAVHLIAFLEAYAWITLFPVNPITLQKYREAFVTSRAKNDTQDADFLADLLLIHHATLKSFYHLNGSRSVTLQLERLTLIEKAVPVTDDRALIESFVLRVQLICRQLDLVQRTIADYDRQIAEAFAAHPDHQIFESLPGAGPVLATRLLTTMGSERERFESSAQLQHYTGIAPVTKKSGGYGYMLRKDATSLTEAWDANPNSSHNHFMLGQITEWFYKDLAGIDCDPAGPGFKKILIHPQPVGDLTWVRASYDSVRGKIHSEWRRDAGKFSLKVKIPANTTATVILPVQSGKQLKEGGKPAGEATGVKLLRTEPDRTVLAVESGEYEFTAE